MNTNTQKKAKSLVDLAKILGLEKEDIEYIEKQLPNEPTSKQLQITQILWEEYFKLEDLLTEHFYQKLLSQVMEGKISLSQDLYDKAKEQADNIINSLQVGQYQDFLKIQELRRKISLLSQNAPKN